MMSCLQFLGVLAVGFALGLIVSFGWWILGPGDPS